LSLLTKLNRDLETPFKIKFSKEVLETSNKTILDKFKISFNYSYCDNLEVLNDNKLIVRNEFIRIKPDLNWNLWTGVGYAELRIIDIDENKTKRVEYLIDFTRISVSSIIFIFFIVFILVSSLSSNELLDFLKIIFFGIIPLLMIAHIFLFLRHRTMFFRTLKTPIENFGNYNWKEIFEKKTNHELIEISKGKRHLPEEVIGLAIRELEKRKTEIQ